MEWGVSRRTTTVNMNTPEPTNNTKEMWVGDPCYIIDMSQWADVLDYTRYFNLFSSKEAMGKGEGYNPKDKQNGVFTLKDGVTCAVSTTAYGDGYYPDDEGRHYGVDAGMLGIFPAEYARTFQRNGGERNPHLGHFITVPADYKVTVSYDEGTIDFGVVCINTK